MVLYKVCGVKRTHTHTLYHGHHEDSRRKVFKLGRQIMLFNNGVNKITESCHQGDRQQYLGGEGGGGEGGEGEGGGGGGRGQGRGEEGGGGERERVGEGRRRGQGRGKEGGEEGGGEKVKEEGRCDNNL